MDTEFLLCKMKTTTKEKSNSEGQMDRVSIEVKIPCIEGNLRII